MSRLDIDLDTAEQFHAITDSHVWPNLVIKQNKKNRMLHIFSILIAKISLLLKRLRNKPRKLSRLSSLDCLDN